MLTLEALDRIARAFEKIAQVQAGEYKPRDNSVLVLPDGRVVSRLIVIDECVEGMSHGSYVVHRVPRVYERRVVPNIFDDGFTVEAVHDTTWEHPNGRIDGTISIMREKQFSTKRGIGLARDEYYSQHGRLPPF